MNTEWRPDDWNTKTPFSFDISRSTFEAGADAMLSARDKWWIERIQKEVFDGGCYILRADTKATCEKCGAYPICHMVKWQQLKLSLQSSSALTNLMGKFPDLPDVREVGQ